MAEERTRNDIILHLRNRTLARLTYYSPLYFYRRSRAAKGFSFNGSTHTLHYNHLTYRSERAIEIAIALRCMEGYKGKEILEVGNTLHVYNKTRHDVIDKYDHRNNCMEVDLFDYNPRKKYNLIFSISTLEHVGWDERPRQRGKFLPAVRKLKSLLKKNGLLLFTVPIGYNADIDAMIKANKVPFEHYFFKRVSQYNEWSGISQKEAKSIVYGKPYLFANGIMVGLVRNTKG